MLRICDVKETKYTTTLSPIREYVPCTKCRHRGTDVCPILGLGVRNIAKHKITCMKGERK